MNPGLVIVKEPEILGAGGMESPRISPERRSLVYFVREQVLLGQHDLSYRLFFSHVRMVCDLLREMIGEAWVEVIDFGSAERVNASFVSETRRNRESDVIWKFRRRDAPTKNCVKVCS